jgi:hypothetical protein
MPLTTLLCSLALAAPHRPAPTVVIPLLFSEIVQQAELIVVGRPARSECRIEENGRTIRTYVTFEDLVVHHGSVVGSLTLRLEGGDVGDDHLRIPDMPRFALGRTYLMFVAGNGKRVSPIVGFHQGVFEVTASEGRQVLRNHQGLELIGVQNDRFVFSARDLPSARPPAPALGAADTTVVPAAPDVQERKARLRRQLAETPPRPVVAELTPPDQTRRRDTGEGPPPVSPHANGAMVADKSPVFVPRAEDRGARIGLGSLVAEALRAR